MNRRHVRVRVPLPVFCRRLSRQMRCLQLHRHLPLNFPFRRQHHRQVLEVC